MTEVFLGGTCADSTWREKLIPMLEVDSFNPVVPDWNDEAYELELFKRATSDYVLYVITPEMEGVYSIAEVVDDSNKRPEKTIFCFLDSFVGKVFNKSQVKSLTATAKLVAGNGALVFTTLEDIAAFLNSN